MTWRSFMDFWIMRELDQSDAIFRNYDLVRFAPSPNGMHLFMAVRRLNISEVRNTHEALNAIPHIAQRIADMGGSRPEYDQVNIRLRAWYTWDRRRKGEINQWFMSQMVKESRSKSS